MKRFISTFVLHNSGKRVWTIISGETPETAPLDRPDEALRVFLQHSPPHVEVASTPVWDGENGRFTTWGEVAHLRGVQHEQHRQ